MASEKKDDLKVTEQLKDVSPWAERIGVYIIGLMTTVGLALIMYTGVRAATYAPAEVTELLVHEDIVRPTDSNNDGEDESTDLLDDDEILDNEDADGSEDEVIVDEEDDELDGDTELPTSFIGAAISDGIFVREQPQSDEFTPILEQLREGHEVKVINSNYNENWMQVEFNGKIAYVGQGLLIPVE